jgi:hypothetical protein
VVSRALGLLWRPDHPKAPQLEEFKAALTVVSAEQQPKPLNDSEAGTETGDEGQIHA